MPCTKDTDCEEGVCNFGECTLPSLGQKCSTKCAQNLICVNEVCLARCKGSSECATVEYCDRDSGKCVAKGGPDSECKDDYYCMSTLRCIQGKCQVLKKCLSKEECSPWEYCDLTDGLCKLKQTTAKEPESIVPNDSKKQPGLGRQDKAWIIGGAIAVVLIVGCLIFSLLNSRKKNRKHSIERQTTSDIDTTASNIPAYDSQPPKYEEALFCSTRYEEKISG